MEKKRKPEQGEAFAAVCKTALAALVLLAVGIFALSALVHAEIVGAESIPYLLYAVYAAAAFGATAILLLYSQKQLLLKGLIAQGVLLGLLLLFGIVLYGTSVDWIRVAVAAGITFFAVAAAVALFGKRKKKNFRKNTTIRLKKK